MSKEKSLPQDLVGPSHSEEKIGLTQAEEKQFTSLLRSVHSRAMRLALLSCKGKKAEAEHIVQEASLKAARAFTDFQTEKEFAPWFLKIVRHTAIDHYRSDKRRTKIQEVATQDYDLIHPEPASTEHSLERNQWISLLQQTIDKLPAEQRNVVRDYYLRDLSVSEIATTYSLNESAVKKILFVARRLLKPILLEIPDVQAWINR